MHGGMWLNGQVTYNKNDVIKGNVNGVNACIVTGKQIGRAHV